MEWIGPPDYLCEREPIDSFGMGSSLIIIAGHGQRDRTEFWRHYFEPVDVHDQSTTGAFAIEPESELRSSGNSGVHSDSKRLQLRVRRNSNVERDFRVDHLHQREPVDSFSIGQFDCIARHCERDRAESRRRYLQCVDVHDQSIRDPFAIEPESELRDRRRPPVHSDSERVQLRVRRNSNVERDFRVDHLRQRQPIDSFGICHSDRFAGHGQRDRAESRRCYFERVDVHHISSAFAIQPGVRTPRQREGAAFILTVNGLRFPGGLRQYS